MSHLVIAYLINVVSCYKLLVTEFDCTYIDFCPWDHCTHSAYFKSHFVFNLTDPPSQGTHKLNPWACSLVLGILESPCTWLTDSRISWVLSLLYKLKIRPAKPSLRPVWVNLVLELLIPPFLIIQPLFLIISAYFIHHSCVSNLFGHWFLISSLLWAYVKLNVLIF